MTKNDFRKAFEAGKLYGDGELGIVDNFDFSKSPTLTAFDVWFNDWLRIKKIGCIFDPKFNLISSPNKKTGNRYLQAKVYWPDVDGKITRLLSFSLGNMINYPDGIKHEVTISKAKKEIHEILMKKFGYLIK